MSLVTEAPDFNCDDGFNLFNMHDFYFHEKIMTMCNNCMLNMMLSSYNIISLSNQYEDDINFDVSMKDHRSIAEAISSDNPDRAEKAMEDHIRMGLERIRDQKS